MECAGGRNTQTALQHVLREEPYGEFTMTQGVYLLTTGMPDQDMVSLFFILETKGSVPKDTLMFLIHL